jgi:hypothetical protein
MVPRPSLAPLLLSLLLAPLAACEHDHDHDAQGHQHAGSASHDHGGEAGHNHGGQAGHDHGGQAGHDHGGQAGHDHGGEAGAAQGGGAGTGAQGSKQDPLACAALLGEAKPLKAATDPAKAADAKMESGGAYRIERTSNGPNHVSFVNLTDHANWHLYLQETGALTGIFVGKSSKEVPGSNATPGCSEELPASYELHLHEPGVYILELTPGTGDLWAYLVEGEAGH